MTTSCQSRGPWPSGAYSLEAPPMILVVDNYDSFTYNLVHYLNELGAETEVFRDTASEW
jgi:hypothetical protein